MPDLASAVSALDNAGQSIQNLESAINGASFLDEIPGEERQKLRAARTLLKKLKAKAAHEAALGIRSGPGLKKIAEVSPWKRDNDEAYDAADFEKLRTKYEDFKWKIISKPGGATMRQDSYYVLYGFDKQATEGDVYGERPMWGATGGIDFDGREKYDHWKECAGMDKERAKFEFVRAYWEFSAKDLFQDTRGDQE